MSAAAAQIHAGKVDPEQRAELLWEGEKNPQKKLELTEGKSVDDLFAFTQSKGLICLSAAEYRRHFIWKGARSVWIEFEDSTFASIYSKCTHSAPAGNKQQVKSFILFFFLSFFPPCLSLHTAAAKCHIWKLDPEHQRWDQILLLFIFFFFSCYLINYCGTFSWF